jgi:hypothetical protein
MSVIKIENMFDTVDDAAVVSAIAEYARAEAAAAAHRLRAIAELVRRRAEGPVDHAHWCATTGM